MWLDLAEQQLAYWADHPPLPVVARALAGVKPQATRGGDSDMRDMSAKEIAAKFGGKAVKGAPRVR